MNDPIPRSRLELTALLDLEHEVIGAGFFKTTALALAKRLKIRDTGIIQRRDYVEDFKRMSAEYEGPNYPPQYTSELAKLITEGTEESYVPGAKLVIENDGASVTITSYHPDGTLMNAFEPKPILDKSQVRSYGAWLRERLDEPFKQIQIPKAPGEETHMSYLQNQHTDNLTAGK